jgi:hypothetical protein
VQRSGEIYVVERRRERRGIEEWVRPPVGYYSSKLYY